MVVPRRREGSVFAAQNGILEVRCRQMFLSGGIPLLMDGKIVVAIGVCGALSAQDAQCAKAGAGILK